MHQTFPEAFQQWSWLTYEEEQYLTQPEETGLEKVQRSRILEHSQHQALVLSLRLVQPRLALAAAAASVVFSDTPLLPQAFQAPRSPQPLLSRPPLLPRFREPRLALL